ncbi:MAG: carboxylesterase [Thiobacillaceae bacterium]
MLSYIEIPARNEERAVMLWLHGLGADGGDLEPVVELLGISGLRHILPDAPARPVTINGGMRMRAWYDIAESDFYGGKSDEAGLMASADAVAELANRCASPGTPMFMAGFSQGGAVALAVGLKRLENLAGVIVLSGYVPQFLRSGECYRPPIFMAHGTRDQVVFPDWGHASHDWLVSEGFTVCWREYPMAHAICQEEIQHLAEWVQLMLQRYQTRRTLP